MEVAAGVVEVAAGVVEVAAGVVEVAACVVEIATEELEDLSVACACCLSEPEVLQ